MRPHIRRFLFAAVLVQTGCAPVATTDPDQLPAQELPVGSSFFLNHDINVRSGVLALGIPGVVIQDGRMVGRFKVQQFEPYCEFFLNERAKGDTIVSADNFVVESVSSSRNFMRRGTEPKVLAAGPGFRLAESEAGASGFTITVIDYSLSSEFQGPNYRLTCMSVADSTSPRSFTVGDIRDTLGTLFSIQIAVNRSLEVQ